MGMAVVTQETDGRTLYGTQTTDRDGFAINAWTARREDATEFVDPLDAEDDAATRFHRGQYLAGYTVHVRA
jgi:hypothetical protein